MDRKARPDQSRTRTRPNLVPPDDASKVAGAAIALGLYLFIFAAFWRLDAWLARRGLTWRWRGRASYVWFDARDPYEDLRLQLIMATILVALGLVAAAAAWFFVSGQGL